jgi:hypothetical protein
MDRLIWILVALVLALAGCQPAPSAAASGVVEVEALAGPTCPVETDPPDPECAPRPVANALVLVQPADGRDIVAAQGSTDANGHVRLELPPGDYLVIGAAVEGLMGTPQPIPVSVTAGRVTSVELAYDTGIR